MSGKTPYHSWKLNNLADGCKQCVLGRKLVVFVTGVCPKNCFYCPLSEQKKNKDVIFANERPLKDENDLSSLINEAEISKSYGAGFTGGDPLVRIERTVKFIKALKKRFGKKFHTHLYTILESLTNERIRKLEKAGLDELRVHPDIMSDKEWHKIELLKTHKFDFGVEIPSIPGYEKETKKLIDYFIDKIDFLNINEREISDTNSCELIDRKFYTKDRTSYGVKGSQELALKLLHYINKTYPQANVHYCTCKLKDGVQLKERLKLRAMNSHKKFDIVTDDGTLIRGCIYLKELKPGFSYIKRIKDIRIEDRKKLFIKLEKILHKLQKKYYIPKDMMIIDELKPRIITNIGVVKELSKTLKAQGLIPAVVEQYPSYDQMEVDVEFI